MPVAVERGRRILGVVGPLLADGDTSSAANLLSSRDPETSSGTRLCGRIDRGGRDPGNLFPLRRRFLQDTLRRRTNGINNR
jgi:hypothetical protein